MPVLTKEALQKAMDLLDSRQVPDFNRQLWYAGEVWVEKKHDGYFYSLDAKKKLSFDSEGKVEINE